MDSSGFRGAQLKMYCWVEQEQHGMPSFVESYVYAFYVESIKTHQP
jgi:hypothetical protein